MLSDVDSSEEESSKKLPVMVVPEPEGENPPIRPRRFITNGEYASSLVIMLTFAFLVYVVQWLTTIFPILGFIGAVIILVLGAEWERRARHTLGRVRQRAHFDPLNLVKLPVHVFPQNAEVEPPTPYVSNEETIRSDPATILRRAQETISGASGISGGTAETGAQSAMELALINLLKVGVLLQNIKLDEARDQPLERSRPVPVVNSQRSPDRNDGFGDKQ